VIAKPRELEARLPRWQYCRGEQSITLLKAWQKALSDSYPSERAMLETESLELISRSPAASIRQRVRYSMGDAPTVFLNFKAKIVRDIPARFARDCNSKRLMVLWPKPKPRSGRSTCW
jgi:hypothetical protein